MKWFYKLEAKYGRYAFKNLTKFLILITLLGFVVYNFFYETYIRYMTLDISKVMQGEIWRVFTFIIVPESDLIYCMLNAYVLYWLGVALENAWGTFKYNVYVISGIFLHLVAALVVYFVWGFNNIQFGLVYLEMTMFLAYTIIYANSYINLFFFLPIKAKWLGLIDGVILARILIKGLIIAPIKLSNLSTAANQMSASIYENDLIYGVSALISTLNLFVFLLMISGNIKNSVVEHKRRTEFKKIVKRAQKNTKYIHKCAICGRTEEDGDLTFRYCSKCNGNYEYCNEHLYTHQHIE